MPCYQNKDIFIIDIPTRSISVHKNDQHVQGWKPTTSFSKIAKIQKNNGNWKKLKTIFMYVDNYSFVRPLFTSVYSFI